MGGYIGQGIAKGRGPVLAPGLCYAVMLPRKIGRSRAF